MKDQVSFCKYNNNSYNDIDKILSWLKVQSFRNKGLSVAYVCGDDDEDEQMKVGVVGGNYQLLFFTPGSLLTWKWREVIMSDKYRERVRGLIIDEAHCIKK